jgi:hypothetical protein
MKRWQLPVMTIVVVATSVWGVYRVLEGRVQKKREAAYLQDLRSYSDALKPGMSRKELESYLKARGIKFRQMCCLGQNRGVYDDLVKIGEEKPQWVCSRQVVYVGFQFTANKQHAAWTIRRTNWIF